MNTVYVVQEKHGMDFTPAVKYGKLVTVLPARDRMLDLSSSMLRIHDKMLDFSDSDYIVATGHPNAIALVTSIAARLNGGRYKMLVWDRDLQGYFSTQVDVSRVPQQEIQI